jgi:hypothetical protein
MPRRLIVAALAVMAVAATAYAALAQAQVAPTPISTPNTTAAVTPTPQEQAVAEAKRKAELRARALRARHLRHVIKKYRSRTWYWLDVMGKPRKNKPYFVGASRNLGHLKKMLHVWKKRARRARYRGHHPPMLGAWLCIHRHEGPWNSSTNPKYDGGLQMDDNFQNTYGARWRRLKGPAYNWTMWEQIWTAVKAYFSGRGFTPWPHTRIPCGV